MKPIKIVQRETKEVCRLEIEVDTSASTGNPYLSVRVNPEQFQNVPLSKPTARRLAAALLKIAGDGK